MKKFFDQSGQSLISLLFFTVMGITVISAAALIVTADFLSASNSEKGLTAYYAAESGVENGILYILSHPTYSGSLTMPNATVTINYDGSSVSTITAVGENGTTMRTLQAKAKYENGIFNVFEWKEQ